MTQTQKKRMVYLIETLNDARDAYYCPFDVESPLSDKEYDKLFDELIELETATGIRMSDSPTSQVGFPVPDSERKVKHFAPILSLNYTKKPEEIQEFLGAQDGVLSWKLDGVSIVLYYMDGELKLAASRGNGIHGKDITHNVTRLNNVPRTIGTKNELIIRGEGVMSLSDFEIINKEIEDKGYSNPRNLTAGLLNATRNISPLLERVSFVAHTIVHMQEQISSYQAQLECLECLGFDVVESFLVNKDTVRDKIQSLSDTASSYRYPVDGLVLTYNDTKYARSLGSTQRAPRHSMSFKWPDATAETQVTGMKWSVSPTNQITPVVLVKQTPLEGTMVRQINLHNLKKFESLQIGIGDTVRIYKANKIIPSIEENLTRSNTERYPEYCPICGATTCVIESAMTRKLYCSSQDKH